MEKELKIRALSHIEHHADLCVVGGGLSGVAAALAAAREGAKVLLMQDRPMFGGNASSEIRMWVRGALGKHNRETGILSELEEENIYRNPGLVPTLWDSVIYGKVKSEKNIEVLLNCSCVDAETKNGAVRSVTGWQLTTYTWHTVYADYFADCSGDSVLAPATGALYRMGREGNAEYRETIGPADADAKTMGMSCLLQARETDHPVPFTAPDFAYVYETDDDFGRVEELCKMRDHAVGYDKKPMNYLHRDHDLATDGTNFWWLELGGEDDAIADTEKMRDELLRIAFGVWDHIKNHGDHHAENWELEWVGFLPGKRESRRYIGDHVLTQSDVESEGRFEDLIAYGGWQMDDHNPAGFFATGDEPASLIHLAPSPYGIPYRCLYSKNIKNLFFAGRNISATHAANSSTRVMATCTLLGQAMGTAAGMCVKRSCSPRGLYERGDWRELQSKLLDAGCYLPWHTRKIPPLTLRASCDLSEGEKELLFNGLERPDAEWTVNYATLPVGGEIRFAWNAPERLSELRIVFDPDFSRESVSPHHKMQIFAQRCNLGLNFRPMTVANTLVRSFEVLADGKTVFETAENYHSLVRLPLDLTAKTLTVRFRETWGKEEVHLFSCDVK